jgi:hypothetical protein
MLEGPVRLDTSEIRILGLDWQDQGAAIRSRIDVP